MNREPAAWPIEPPRPTTARTWYRAWIEPRVRFWWLTTLTLLIILAFAVTEGIRAWYHTIDLINNGVPIRALVIQAGEMKIPRPQPPDSIVTLQFTWFGKTLTTDPQKLDGWKLGQYITPGDRILIHVNADDPRDWTPRTEVDSIGSRLIGRVFPVPLVILAVLFTFFIHRRMLQSWRRGNAIAALVLDTFVSSVAPFGRAAHVTPENDRDKRVYTVYLPHRLCGIARGQYVFILKPSTRASTAVAAAWFD